MKKLISSLLAAAMTFSIASVTSFAVSTATLSITDDKTTVNAGDVIEAVVIIDSTVNIANYTVTVKYDKNVFELVNSDTYEAFAADPDNQAIAAEAGMDMVDVYKEMTGYTSVMGDSMTTFWDSNTTKKLGGLGTAMSSDGYPIFLSSASSKVSALKAVKNAYVAAAKLKVKADAPAGTSAVYTTQFAASDGAADTFINTTPIDITVQGSTPPATTYAVTLGEGVTTTYEGVLTAVPENTKITVTATEKPGYTATLKKTVGVNTEVVASPYELTVTADTSFAVDYAPKHEYTLDDKGTCSKTEGGRVSPGIYYSLSVKNVANKLAIKVSDKTFEIPAGVPTVTGDAVAQLTYVILGVPDTMTEAPDLSAVTSGETVYTVAE